MSSMALDIRIVNLTERIARLELRVQQPGEHTSGDVLELLKARRDLGALIEARNKAVSPPPSTPD